jgi:hypothetical protein
MHALLLAAYGLPAALWRGEAADEPALNRDQLKGNAARIGDALWPVRTVAACAVARSRLTFLCARRGC